MIDIQHRPGRRGANGIIADGALIVLEALTRRGPVRRSCHQVDAVDNEQFEVQDSVLEARADGDRVAKLVVAPLSEDVLS